MRTARIAVLLTVAATGTAVSVASAAPPKPACRFITDPPGDVQVAGNAPVTDGRLDLVSADLGTDRTRVTVVVRVTDVDGAPAVASSGALWLLEFRADNTTYQITAERLADGDRFTVLREAPVRVSEAGLTVTTTMEPVALVTGVVDPAANEVRITAPLSAFGPRAMKRGSWLERISVYAEMRFGSTQDDSAAVSTPVKDVAIAGKPFVVGTASCVRVGR